MPDTREEIMDCAEEAIRRGGYAAFSFRTIAEELAIKSASVHYHFPTKDALVVATTERYQKRFFVAIGDSSDVNALQNYTNAFENALADDFAVCLCGTLASEGDLLSDETREALVEFTDNNLAWLTEAFIALGGSRSEAKELASVAFSALEGAIIFAAITRRKKLLKQVAEFVLKLGTDLG